MFKVVRSLSVLLYMYSYGMYSYAYVHVGRCVRSALSLSFKPRENKNIQLRILNTL